MSFHKYFRFIYQLIYFRLYFGHNFVYYMGQILFSNVFRFFNLFINICFV